MPIGVLLQLNFNHNSQRKLVHRIHRFMYFSTNGESPILLVFVLEADEFLVQDGSFLNSDGRTDYRIVMYREDVHSSLSKDSKTRLNDWID